MTHFRNRACAKALVSMTLSNELPFVLILIRDGANASTKSGRVAEQISDVLFSWGYTPVDLIATMRAPAGSSLSTKHLLMVPDLSLQRARDLLYRFEQSSFVIGTCQVKETPTPGARNVWCHSRLETHTIPRREALLVESNERST